ncbi:MAG: hypothetical protein R2856_07745 [Caldilineaceae bacterium]
MEQSEGNPFVLEEVRRALVEDGILVEANHAWGMDDAAFAQCSSEGMAIPEAVRMSSRIGWRGNPRPPLVADCSHVTRGSLSTQLLTASGGRRNGGDLPEQLDLAAIGGREAKHRPRTLPSFNYNMQWRTVLAELTPSTPTR